MSWPVHLFPNPHRQRQTLLDRVESSKSLMQQLKSTPRERATWERQSSASIPSWKVHCNSMGTNDEHQGCSTSKELKRSFEPMHRRLIGEESKDLQTYKGSVGRLILE